MPCYTEPQRADEAYRQNVAQLLGYVYMMLGTQVPQDVINTAHDDFARKDYTPVLCGFLKDMSEAEIERIVYARTKLARRLANWWEQHQEDDKAHIQQEANKAFNEKLSNLKHRLYKIPHDKIQEGSFLEEFNDLLTKYE